MKTTSFEISKELKELGFEAETIFYINLETEESQIWLNLPKYPLKEFVKSYGLETILDALPKLINYGRFKNLGLRIYYEECCYIGYEDSNGFLQDFTVNNKLSKSSLADTAARLLIKLIKDKIVKL